MSIKCEDKIRRIITGSLKYSSSGLGFNMLMARMQKKYAANPSEEGIKECLAEIEEFATKFPGVIEKDYNEIAKL